MAGQAPIQDAPRTTLYGVDFSGAKDAGKRIWIAAGTVRYGSLTITGCYPARDLPGSGRYPDPGSFRQRCRTGGGARELKRRTDQETRTPFSPYNLRLYRQTYYGISRLLNPLIRDQQASVLPMQQPHPERPWLLEICPASTLKRGGLSTSYKGRGRRAARESILSALEDAGRLTIQAGSVRQDILKNRCGDALDSVIAVDALFRALQRPAELLPAEPAYRLEGYVYV